MTSSAGARRFRDTPARLAFQRNLLAALIIAWASSTIGVLGLVRSSSIRVKKAADQVVLVQETKVQLTRADSLATSGYLTGGLQSDQALAAFASDMASANAGLAAISRSVGGVILAGTPNAPNALDASTDRNTEVGEANVFWLINSYITDVTAAQANNRQGWPVGATYQKTASANLRTRILPRLDLVDDQARQSLVDAGRRLGWSWAVQALFALLVAIPLGLALATLAVRTNRLLNVPILLGFAVSFAAFLLATSIAGTSRTDGLRGIRTAFRYQDLSGQARVAAYNAKSAEALTLISRGSGQPYEVQWRQNMSDLDAVVATDFLMRSDQRVVETVAAYRASHIEVRKLDDSGDWDSARRVVLAPNGTVSAPTFQALDEAIRPTFTGSVIDPQVGRDITIAQLAVGLASLVAAALVRAGFAQRLKEYQ